MANPLSNEYLLEALSAIRVNTALIPRIEKRLDDVNNSIVTCIEDIDENRQRCAVLERIEESRSARWKVTLNWALKVLEGLVLALAAIALAGR